MGEPAFEAFAVALAAAGVSSPNTQRAYAGVIRRWQASGCDMLAWAVEQLAGAPAGTAGQVRAALRHWRVFCALKPLVFPRGARARRVGREPLDDTQLATFYRKIQHAPGLLPAVRCVLALLPRTGLRISEACALRGEHVRRAEGGWAVRVIGKGGHARTVPLTAEAYRILCAYADTHRPENACFEAGAWVFEGGAPGAPLPADTVRSQLRSIRGAQGWVPHVLRHTFATRYFHATGDLLGLSQILGHRSMETTRIYVQASASHKRAGMEQAELRPPRPKRPRKGKKRGRRR